MLGVWLAGCVFMDMVATQNFRSVDRLLAAGISVPKVQLSAAIRVFGGMLLPDIYLTTVIASAICWSSAFMAVPTVSGRGSPRVSSGS